MNLSSPDITLEIIASKFRTTKHMTQKQLKKIIRKLINIKNRKGQSANVLQVLQQSKEQLVSLKRKLSNSCQQQSKYYDICKKRLHKHQQYSKDGVQYKNIKDSKLQFEFNTQIMQYLYNCCQFQRAKKFQKALGQEDMFSIQTEVLERCYKIIQDIKSNKLQSVQLWIFQNNHNLDKIQSTIMFDLLACEYINLIYQDQVINACHLLRKQLKNMKLNFMQHQTIQKLSYLLIDKQTNPPNLQNFLQSLEQTFRINISSIYSINFNSQLQKNIIIGLSALKTVCCVKAETRNKDICPVCCQRSMKLSQKIPMLTKQSSIFVCRINRSVMNEENHPMALPSGQIYSITGLNDTQKNGFYYCLVTQTWYPKNMAKKVFLA